MKQLEYKRLIIACIAFSLLLSACGKDNETQSTKNSSTGSEISFISDEASDTADDSKSTGDEKPEPSDDKSDPSGESSEDPSDASAADPSDSSDHPVTAQVSLGAANLANGGFATGDKKYIYYVSHTTDGRCSIYQEDRVSGSRQQVYLSVPKDTVILDSLNLVGDTLFFRENQSESGTFMIVKLYLSDLDYEILDDADITGLTVYDDHIYYSKDSCLVRCDLDGKNKEVLFESDHSAMEARITFCIANDKIYFIDPETFATGGMFFGTIFSIDPDGKHQNEVTSDVQACNEEIFFSDGETLFFYGNTEKDGNAYFSCGLDGSGLTLEQKASPCSRNVVDGKVYQANDFELYENRGSGFELIYTGNMDMGRIVIIDDDIYFTDTDATAYKAGVAIKRLSLSSNKETTLG